MNWLATFLTTFFALAIAANAQGLAVGSGVADFALADPIFLSRILDYRDCRQCYFVSLEVSSDVYTGKVVIENDDLFVYISEVYNVDSGNYTAFMKDLLMSGKPLILQKAVLAPQGLSLKVEGVGNNQFLIPKATNDLKKTLSKGCAETVRSYFIGSPNDGKGSTDVCGDLLKNQRQMRLVLGRELVAGPDAALIAQLFAWGIPVRFDDLSGRLLIEN